MNSYSQCGEDMIVQHFLHQEKGTYVDVGAHHPKEFNNTYHFYEKGWRGILVEPLPKRCEELRTSRPEDTVMECGVGTLGKDNLFLYEPDVLTSFQRGWAPLAPISGTLSVDRFPLSEILSMQPLTNLLSIDVEGSEMDVLASNAWERFRPLVVIVETKIYRGCEVIEPEVTTFMHGQGYVTLGSSYINTLYCLPEIRR